MPDRIRLICPEMSHREAALEFIAEFKDHNSTPNGSSGLERYPEDYEGWLAKLEREADEKTVESGKVPADTCFAVREEDSKLVGMINIRRRLNDFLLHRGGHIGYCIRPTERGKGYATEMLGLGLGLCQELGLEKVLVTCDKNNIPSMKTIQHHGGILENEVFVEESSSYFQRYWIKVDEALAAENGMIKRILAKAGNPRLLSELGSALSLSEINTLLLEVFRLKTHDIRSGELLRRYGENRFANPSDIDPAISYRFSAELLDTAKKYNYTALELSPVTVLGACSVIAQVDQNKVLTALRGTEVVSDATNALALHICALKNRGNMKKKRLRYCAIHRHLRTQKFQGPMQLSHFTLYGMVISGVDEGNLKFEKEALHETLRFYHEYLSGQDCLRNPRFILWPRGGEEKENFTGEILAYLRQGDSWDIREEEAPSENNYYLGLQFKIKATYGDREYEIGDGGFVDWPRKLLQNNKERMLVSAIGLERLLKMSSGLF